MCIRDRLAIPLLIFLNILNTAHAGIFGPDNYEECVLDKMKGQAKNLIYVARKACEKKFPYEKDLGSYSSEYEFSWMPYNDNSVYFSISKNYGEYKITRVNVTFSSSLCSDNTSLPSEHTKTVELSDKEDASITSVPAISYKCARVNNLWGIIKS